MIGGFILALGALALFIGICVVLWEWVVRSDPDAPNGTPVIGVAVALLLFGGLFACTETLIEVQKLKRDATPTQTMPGGK